MVPVVYFVSGAMVGCFLGVLLIGLLTASRDREVGFLIQELRRRGVNVVL